MPVFSSERQRVSLEKTCPWVGAKVKFSLFSSARADRPTRVSPAPLARRNHGTRSTDPPGSSGHRRPGPCFVDGQGRRRTRTQRKPFVEVEDICFFTDLTGELVNTRRRRGRLAFCSSTEPTLSCIQVDSPPTPLC